MFKLLVILFIIKMYVRYNILLIIFYIYNILMFRFKDA